MQQNKSQSEEQVGASSGPSCLALDHRASGGPDPEIEWQGGDASARSFLAAAAGSLEHAGAKHTAAGATTTDKGAATSTQSQGPADPVAAGPDDAGAADAAGTNKSSSSMDTDEPGGASNASTADLIQSAGAALEGRFVALYRPALKVSLVAQVTSFDANSGRHVLEFVEAGAGPPLQVNLTTACWALLDSSFMTQYWAQQQVMRDAELQKGSFAAAEPAAATGRAKQGRQKTGNAQDFEQDEEGGGDTADEPSEQQQEAGGRGLTHQGSRNRDKSGFTEVVGKRQREGSPAAAAALDQKQPRMVAASEEAGTAMDTTGDVKQEAMEGSQDPSYNLKELVRPYRSDIVVPLPRHVQALPVRAIPAGPGGHLSVVIPTAAAATGLSLQGHPALALISPASISALAPSPGVRVMPPPRMSDPSGSGSEGMGPPPPSPWATHGTVLQGHKTISQLQQRARAVSVSGDASAIDQQTGAGDSHIITATVSASGGTSPDDAVAAASKRRRLSEIPSFGRTSMTGQAPRSSDFDGSSGSGLPVLGRDATASFTYPAKPHAQPGAGAGTAEGEDREKELQAQQQGSQIDAFRRQLMRNTSSFNSSDRERRGSAANDPAGASASLLPAEPGSLTAPLQSTASASVSPTQQQQQAGQAGSLQQRRMSAATSVQRRATTAEDDSLMMPPPLPFGARRSSGGVGPGPMGGASAAAAAAAAIASSSFPAGAETASVATAQLAVRVPEALLSSSLSVGSSIIGGGGSGSVVLNSAAEVEVLLMSLAEENSLLKRALADADVAQKLHGGFGGAGGKSVTAGPATVAELARLEGVISRQARLLEEQAEELSVKEAELAQARLVVTRGIQELRSASSLRREDRRALDEAKAEAAAARTRADALAARLAELKGSLPPGTGAGTGTGSSARRSRSVEVAADGGVKQEQEAAAITTAAAAVTDGQDGQDGQQQQQQAMGVEVGVGVGVDAAMPPAAAASSGALADKTPTTEDASEKTKDGAAHGAGGAEADADEQTLHEQLTALSARLKQAEQDNAAMVARHAADLARLASTHERHMAQMRDRLAHLMGVLALQRRLIDARSLASGGGEQEGQGAAGAAYLQAVTLQQEINSAAAAAAAAVASREEVMLASAGSDGAQAQAQGASQQQQQQQQPLGSTGAGSGAVHQLRRDSSNSSALAAAALTELQNQQHGPATTTTTSSADAAQLPPLPSGGSSAGSGGRPPAASAAMPRSSSQSMPGFVRRASAAADEGGEEGGMSQPQSGVGSTRLVSAASRPGSYGGSRTLAHSLSAGGGHQHQQVLSTGGGLSRHASPKVTPSGDIYIQQSSGSHHHHQQQMMMPSRQSSQQHQQQQVALMRALGIPATTTGAQQQHLQQGQGQGQGLRRSSAGGGDVTGTGGGLMLDVSSPSVFAAAQQLPPVLPLSVRQQLSDQAAAAGPGGQVVVDIHDLQQLLAAHAHAQQHQQQHPHQQQRQQVAMHGGPAAAAGLIRRTSMPQAGSGGAPRRPSFGTSDPSYPPQHHQLPPRRMTGSGALPAGAASLGPQEVTLTLDPATAAQLLAQHGAGAGAGQTVQLPGGRSLQMPLQQLFLPTQGGPPPPSSNPHAGGHRASAPPSFSGLPSPAQAQQQALLADMAAAGGGDPHQQQQEVINAMMLARAVQQQQQGQSQQQGVSIAGLEGLNLMALAGGEITPQMLLQGGMPITIAGPGPSQGQGQGQQRQQGGGGSGGGAGGQQQQQQVVRVVWENAGGSGAGRP